MQTNMVNLEEQLTILTRSNGSKQYDTNVDFIVNDLKKKHSQEVTNIQDQYKNLLVQIKSKVLFLFILLFIKHVGLIFYFLKDRHCTLLTNELKKLQQDHHRIIVENNNLISNFSKKLNTTQKDSDSKNYEEIINLSNQLMECSKQNQHLNITLQHLTVSENKF